MPYEVMETYASDRPPRAPALNGDPCRMAGEADGASPLLMLALALAFICMTALFFCSH